MQKLLPLIKQLLVITIVGCFGLPLQSQILKGKIVDEQSQPLPFATIYIVEKQNGMVSNEDGTFSINLEKGNYTIRFQYVGYETQIKKISISENQTVNIQLKPASILLKEITIRPNSEDPAYNIIRKAIAKAPYYVNQLPTFTSNVYIKGIYRIDKVPNILKMPDVVANDSNSEYSLFKVGNTFTRESINEIIKAKEQIKHRVISSTNSFPPSFGSTANFADRFLLLDIYRMETSPISRTALSNYKYKLEKSIKENDIIIHHIRVTPKTGNPNLYSGTINIIEGLWCVYGFDLSSSLNAGFFSADFQFQQRFSELEPQIYQPVSYVVFINFKMFGMETFMSNTASISYLEYTTRDTFVSLADTMRITNTDTSRYIISEKSQQLQKSIEELSSKENLSNKDAVKILKLLDQKAKEDVRNNSDPNKKKNLEVKDTFYVITVDSNAYNYDSTYWKSQRPMELSEKEQEGYAAKALYEAAHPNDEDTISDSTSKRSKRFGLLQGFRWRINPTTRFNASFASDIFNTVDGFTLGVQLTFHKKLEASKDYEFGLRSVYAFSSEHFPTTAYAKFNYLPRKQASMEINVGRRSNDFNRESGVTPFVNSFSSLFFRDNYINFYDRTFINIHHQIEALNGLNVMVDFDYEKQGFLQNTTDYSFFFRSSKDYRSNNPENPYIISDPGYLENSYGAILGVKLEYTPEMYYKYENHKKVNLHSQYPTFSLLWKKGIAGFLGSESRFDQLELNVKQKISWGLLNSFQYNLSGGWFPDHSQMYFSNFKQFNVQEFPLSLNTFSNAYHTLQTYTPATNEWYVSGFTQYTTPYLLIKYLPFLDKTLIMENLYASYLTTPVTKNYIEAGYGLTNIFLFAHIGVFVGFEDFKYANWGLRISFSFLDFNN